MSKIQEMIDRMCPEGVEYYPISKVFDMRNGYTPSTSDASFWEGGTIPWVRMEDIRSQGRVLSDAITRVTPKAAKGNGFFRANSIIVATSATIGEHALVLVEHLSNQRFTNLYPKVDFQGKIDMFFMNYYFEIVDEWCNTHTNKSSFASVDMEQFRNYQIPVPPIEVQREIVKVLDNFSELTAELMAELTAELTARKKQYEYYRDNLLNFNNLNRGGQSELVWRHLSELGGFFGGLTGKSKSDFTDGNAKFITYMNVYSNPAVKLNIEDKVKIAPGEKQNKLMKGDILFTGSSETPDECGMSSVIVDDIKEDYYLNSFCFGFRMTDPSLFNLRFLRHLLRSCHIRNQIVKTASGVTRFNVSKQRFEKIILPILPLDEQNIIADILDKFELLSFSLTDGLSVEIKARQQQYEYYREKLLTFKRAS